MCAAMVRFAQNRSPYMGQINGKTNPHPPPTQSCNVGVKEIARSRKLRGQAPDFFSACLFNFELGERGVGEKITVRMQNAIPVYLSHVWTPVLIKSHHNHAHRN